MRLKWVKRLTALLMTAALLALCGAADAELPWPKQKTGGQKALADYIDAVNILLTERGEGAVNSLFGCWPTLAVLGITGEDDAEIPEDVEITASYTSEDLLYIELRVCDTARFPVICAAMIQVAAGGSMTWEEALNGPSICADRAVKRPLTSFSEPVIYDRGSVPRTYYAYAPNEHHDDRNWLTMVLIFPRDGETGAVTTTPMPESDRDQRPITADEEEREADWVGYDPPLDEAPHYEFFTTPTPEPDSAVYPY